MIKLSFNFGDVYWLFLERFVVIFLWFVVCAYSRHYINMLDWRYTVINDMI